VVGRGDVIGLADAVSGLLHDPDRRQELSDRGEAEFEHRYRIDAVADATVSLYQRLLSGSGDRRR
jgi:glycosyltransferase involved in cell wall biosynthesis